MVQDPVCGMTVDPKTALKSEYKGQTYYFCSRGCQVQFEKNPDKFLSRQNAGHHDHHH